MRLVLMDVPLDEGLVVTMFNGSFDDWSKSLYGVALPSLLTKDTLTWQGLMSRVL